MEHSAFSTHDLPLAAFLHSTRRLRFLRCEPERGRVSFLFEDTRGEGPSVESEFIAGAPAPANAFYESIRFLRRTMDATQSRNREQGQNDRHAHS